MCYFLHLDLSYGTLPSFNYNIIQTIAKDKILLRSDSDSLTESRTASERIYVLADSDEAILRWSARNIPVIAWSHADNEQESLMGTRFMILSPEALTPEYLEEIHCRFYGIPLKILETERCYLRELTLEDLENVLALDQEQTPDSHGRFFQSRRILHPVEKESPEFEFYASYLKNYIQTQYPFYGYGIYGGYQKGTHEFLGIMGFADTEDGQIEFGYAVKKGQQKKGYAKEWGQALIPYAKEQWEFEKIVARIAPDNIASIRTAQACGVISKIQI